MPIDIKRFRVFAPHSVSEGDGKNPGNCCTIKTRAQRRLGEVMYQIKEKPEEEHLRRKIKCNELKLLLPKELVNYSEANKILDRKPAPGNKGFSIKTFKLYEEKDIIPESFMAKITKAHIKRESDEDVETDDETLKANKK